MCVNAEQTLHSTLNCSPASDSPVLKAMFVLFLITMVPLRFSRSFLACLRCACRRLDAMVAPCSGLVSSFAFPSSSMMVDNRNECFIALTSTFRLFFKLMGSTWEESPFRDLPSFVAPSRDASSSEAPIMGSLLEAPFRGSSLEAPPRGSSLEAPFRGVAWEDFTPSTPLSSLEAPFRGSRLGTPFRGALEGVTPPKLSAFHRLEMPRSPPAIGDDPS